MSDPNQPNPPDWIQNLLRPVVSTDTRQPSPELVRALIAQAGTPPAVAPIAEKSVVIKLQDCLAQADKLVGKPLNKDAVLMLLRRIRTVLLPVCGKESALCKGLDAEIQAASKAVPSAERFTLIVKHLEFAQRQTAALAEASYGSLVSKPSWPPPSKDVFIIHGHDELNARRLSQLLQNDFRLNPIVMLAKPGMSRPLTDKFEDEAQKCSFAFALFTPDDDVVKPQGGYRQARPNVPYEVGWFIGRLGKQRVTLLLKDGTNMHSDLHGVSQIRFRDNVEEKFLEIQRELKAVNLA